MPDTVTSRVDKVLEPGAARAYYDRFGAKQDRQGFYEDAATDDLVAHAGFEEAGRVFEFGCGTGKLAARLLDRQLPPAARYLGCDISPTMVGLSTRRLAGHAGRAQVVLSEGAVRFPVPDRAVDRVVSCYVLDLLSPEDIRRFLDESRRVLVPGGRVCVASLTRGVGAASRLVSGLWTQVFRLAPALVGGCRPIALDDCVDARAWRVVHRRVVTPWGVPSEVLVLESAGDPCGSPAPAPAPIP